MTVITRQIYRHIRADLGKKMVFIAGPRQCGKTTLAKELLEQTQGQYYNWDYVEDRRKIQSGKINREVSLWVFDEIHKYRGWKNFLKGVFDKFGSAHQIVVTGSAKLNIFKRGGDSLQGRYFLYRLHPITFSEYLSTPFNEGVEEVPLLKKETHKNGAEAINTLLTRGGFPEPLQAAQSKDAARWRMAYGSTLIKEDVRDLHQIRELDKLELLYERLPDVVGSILSIKSIREDLEVAYETVQHWISVFENLFVCFRILPFGSPKIKAVKKESKLYLWDWARVEKESARLENLLAFHLLRFCHWCEDVEGKKVELRFCRDVYSHETDFILLKDKKPWIAIELKSSENEMDSGLRYLLERVKFPYAFQVHLKSSESWSGEKINGCEVQFIPLARLLSNLP